MPVSTRLRAWARVVAILCFVGLCGGGAMARSVPELRLIAPTPAKLLAPIVIASLPAPQHDTAPSQREAFGLAVSHSGPMSARWQALQPAIRMEARLLTLCRTDRSLCTPAASRFLAIVDVGRASSGLARLGKINRAVNLAIRPMNDLAQYGVPDLWATPLMVFASGAGDCEDYAIVKFVALRLAGMAARDLRLIVVHDRQTGEDHAVTAARLDGRWLILDNRTMMLRTDTDELFLTPLLAFGSGDQTGSSTVATTPAPIRDTDLTLASRG
jgi:predicted transglutaminase-like cysteine proteinase